MPRTCGHSSKVATGNGSDPPKKKGNQPATASHRKRTAASTTSSVNDGTRVSGLASIATASTAAKMAVAKLSTAVAAASSTVTTDGILDTNANKDDSDNFIPSHPCCGKKQKQDSLPFSLTTSTKASKSPPKASKSPPKNKQPKPCVCWWDHCPFPCIGQMLVDCSEDGCTHKMHQQCVEDFERDICYDEDRGKVMDTFYCHMNHPKKDLIESMLDCDNSVIGTGGGKKDTQSAVDPKSPRPLLPP
jgi:hypothetical protein